MKKKLVALLSCALLGGCVGYETDLAAAQEERDALLLQKRMREGCTFVRDQDAYRECLLNTYYSQHPKGYQTAELVDGEPIAIVSNGATTYTQNQQMTQVAPLPPIAGPQIVPYSTTEVTTTDSTFTQEYVAPQTATFVQKQEVVAQVPVAANLPEPETMVQPVPMPEPVVATVTSLPPTNSIPQQDPTWWETYQQAQPTDPVVEPKCPCEDPNDPCPQCYEK